MNPIFRLDSYCSEITTILDFIEDDGQTQLVSFRDSLFTQGGGQPRDYGKIVFEDDQRDVLELVKHKGDIRLRINKLATLRKSVKVKCKLDFNRRYKIMRFHTAQHALAGAFRRLSPDYVSKGMQIVEDLSFCEVSFLSDMTLHKEHTCEAINIVKSYMQAESRVFYETISNIEEAKNKYSLTFRAGDPDIQIKGKVRIIVIENLDVNPCGGTHLKNLKEIGGFGHLELENKENLWRLRFSLN